MKRIPAVFKQILNQEIERRDACVCEARFVDEGALLRPTYS